MTLALAAAHQALEISPDNPEVYNLIGYVHAMDGDFDNALENYKKAIDLDEWYLEPILNAAELLVHPDADPDEAIRLCRRAAEMDLSAQELSDVTLVEVEALLSTGRRLTKMYCCSRFPRTQVGREARPATLKPPDSSSKRARWSITEAPRITRARPGKESLGKRSRAT